MKRGRLQCKDIPDELVIEAIEKATPPHWWSPALYGPWTRHTWRNWDRVLLVFNELMPGVPEVLFYAKVDRLDERGKVCACVHRPYRKGQCRGDLHIPKEEGYCC